MAVNLSKCDKFVAQAIETWQTTQMHDLGFTMTDMSTGKDYMYVLYNDGAGTVVGSIGAPVGIYCLANALVGSATTVTADVTDSANGVPLGVLRGAPTDGQYGFIELVKKGIVTTVLCDTADPAQYQYYKWSADSLLTSMVMTSAIADPQLAVAKSMDSDAALVGYQNVAWL